MLLIAKGHEMRLLSISIDPWKPMVPVKDDKDEACSVLKSFIFQGHISKRHENCDLRLNRFNWDKIQMA